MLFQVFLTRGITPSQGQEFLKRMNTEIDKQRQVNPGLHTVKISGVNRFDDAAANRPVFPDWLGRALTEKAGLAYDAVNLCYFKQFDTEEKAVAMMQWFDNKFRPWIASIFVGQAEVLGNLQARVMDEHADLAGGQSY